MKIDNVPALMGFNSCGERQPINKIINKKISDSKNLMKTFMKNES